MSDVANEFKTAVAEALDRRRAAMTETIRVVRHLRENVLENRARSMAIPMFYAQWEGYIREVFQLYVEHLEACGLPQRNFRKHLLAYAWRTSFNKLKGELSLERQVELIERFMNVRDAPLVFAKTEREIDTKSNLLFAQFQHLCSCLCLDSSQVAGHKQKLDALVHRRNNIAHGGRESRFDEQEIEDAHTLVLDLMSAVETMLQGAVDFRRYEDVG
jgi:hypothetical protein